MNLQSKFKTLKSIINRNGFWTLLVYLFRLMVWRGYDANLSRIFLFILDTPRPSAKSIKAAENHTFKFATLEDLVALKEASIWDISDHNVQAFKKGDRCLLQLDGDAVVGYTWLAASPLVEVMWGFHFNMPDDTAYNYKGFTAPAYRGQSFQPLRHLKLLEHIKTLGQNRLFGFVDHTNINSLNGVKKSGYKKVGVLRSTKKNGNVRFSLKVSKNAWGMRKRS